MVAGSVADMAVEGEFGPDPPACIAISRLRRADLAAKSPIEPLSAWLNGEISETTWFPSIDQELVLTIRRRESLYICGNISKHNPARLTGAARKLTEILDRHGVIVGQGNALQALGDFFQKFHDDILNYQATVIAKLLNDVRWGIHEYLELEYLRALVRDADDDMKYSYRLPKEIGDVFARVCYWDIMDTVRIGPFIERFTANEWLEQRY